jgi:hypothetical protein
MSSPKVCRTESLHCWRPPAQAGHLHSEVSVRPHRLNSTSINIEGPSCLAFCAAAPQRRRPLSCSCSRSTPSSVRSAPMTQAWSQVPPSWMREGPLVVSRIEDRVQLEPDSKSHHRSNSSVASSVNSSSSNGSTYKLKSRGLNGQPCLTPQVLSNEFVSP